MKFAENGIVYFVAAVVYLHGSAGQNFQKSIPVSHSFDPSEIT
jgi:hypothetical protein